MDFISCLTAMYISRIESVRSEASPGLSFPLVSCERAGVALCHDFFCILHPMKLDMKWFQDSYIQHRLPSTAHSYPPDAGCRRSAGF